MTIKKRRLSNSNRPLSGVLMGFAQSTLTELDTALSVKLAKKLSSSNFGDVILEEPVSPLHYNSSHEFKADYLASSLLNKYPLDIGIDRDDVAVTAFLKAEMDCQQTNRSFAPSGIQKWSFWERSVMETARQKIAKVLGPFNWDEACDGFAFGPGATSSLSRRNASMEKKLQYGISATPGAAHAACVVWDFFQGWKSALDENHTTRPRVVKGSRIVTVPKNAKTSRVIALEPDLNMYIQKGLGKLIRRRLRKSGLDLNNAWKENHELAKQGSVFNSYATIDLKSASDSISYKLVEWLLPDDWFEALSLARSRQTLLPSGDWVSLQKFSSMGNGFTFELESLIFWALSTTVVRNYGIEGRTTVFGDDIIVPTQAFDGVRQILILCGFTLNESKTFRDGPFRESCGKHFFKGYDVTPFYLRNEVSSVLTVIHALNRAREWSIHPVYGLVGLEDTYKVFSKTLPAKWQYPRIPYGYGDGALWGNFEEVLPQKAPRGMEGWMCQTNVPVTEQVVGKSRFSVLASLMRMDGQSNIDFSFSKPDSLFAERYKVGRILVTRWQDHGPWHSEIPVKTLQVPYEEVAYDFFGHSDVMM